MAPGEGQVSPARTATTGASTSVPQFVKGPQEGGGQPSRANSSSTATRTATPPVGSFLILSVTLSRRNPKALRRILRTVTVMESCVAGAAPAGHRGTRRWSAGRAAHGEAPLLQPEKAARERRRSLRADERGDRAHRLANTERRDREHHFHIWHYWALIVLLLVAIFVPLSFRNALK